MSRTRSASEHELRDQVERMSRRSAAVGRMVEEYTAPLDISAFTLLRLAERDGPTRASDLATRTRLSRPSVSRCVTALEQSGLVRTYPDPHDGRASLIAITDQGTTYLAHLAEVGGQRMHEMTEGFTADEVDQLARLLLRFNDNADRQAVAPARYRFEGAPS